MVVIHAAWDTEGTGALVVWAEHAERWAEAVARPSEVGSCERSASSGHAPHPFAAPADAVSGALGASGDARTRRVVARAVAGSALLLPPTWRGAPGASPELEGVVGDHARPCRERRWSLRPFEVPALRLGGSDALDVLIALGDGVTAPDAGASVRVLARLAALVLEVAAGGRVVPSLETRGGDHVARWVPLRTGRDAQRLAMIADALPLVACGLGGSGDPRHVVDHAFEALTDVSCREALARTGSLRTRGSPGSEGGSSAADEWLAALCSADGRVRGEPSVLAGLDRLVAEWRAPLMTSAGSWRLCFRLHEPDHEGLAGPSEPDGAGGAAGERWRLELLLQAVDEPTLLIDAAEVWRAGDALQRAARTVELPQDVLLAELGRATHAFPELGEVLAGPLPTTLELDLDGAYRFLSEVAPVLELAGFGVLVPSWWRQPSARLGLRVRPFAARGVWEHSGNLGAQRLADFDWQVVLGDTTLDVAELRRLAELKAPLVRARGQWAELRPGEAQRLVEFLSAGCRRQPIELADVLRASAGAPLPGAGVPIVALDAGGPLGALLRGELAESLEVPATPEGFSGELRPYQRRGVAWIRLLERLGFGACLADDMGLGKTATVVGVLVSDREDGEARGPTLVVCPTSVVGNWHREIERFAPELRVVVHHGAARAQGDVLGVEAARADVVVTSYALAERDRAALASVPWARVVLDEAQQVKNPAAKRTQAVREIPAPRRLALTGTPVENHLGELWSIMEVLNPGLLGSASVFRRQFAWPIERNGDEDAAARLRTLTRPFVLRRLKTDRSVVADLPDKLETKERCPLTREQATLYQAVVDEMLAKIAGAAGAERRGLVLATMLRLKQVCNHPAHYAADASRLAGRSGKLERTVEILEQVRAAGERALVFTQFAQMGKLLRRHLSERLRCPVGFLHGGVPGMRRDELVTALQSPEGTTPVLVVSLGAGGTGLNLTAASHVLHYDRWWNPAVEDQATDRAYRIGQRRDVHVRKLVCAGTVEERIDDVIESKRSLAGRVVGTDESWLTECSTDELAELLRLSAEASEP